EQFWVSSYEFLLSCGYQLRPRYHPHWVPSWGKRHPIVHECDDWLVNYKTNAVDALSINDDFSKIVIRRTTTLRTNN
ncbi:hypothetical protein C8R45DRAFT_779423, partial [Mycena sanguinolenta]